MSEHTGKKQNIFASETQTLRLQDMLLGYANEETFGNIQRQCFFSVSQVIPRLLPNATYVENTKCFFTTQSVSSPISSIIVH